MKILENNLERLKKSAEEATEQNNWPLAIKRWRRLIKSHGNNVSSKSWLWLARCQLNAKDFDGAEKTALEGLKKYPYLNQLAVILGKISSTNEDWLLAASRWKNVVERYGEESPEIAWAQLAKAQRLTGELEAAKSTGLKGLELNEKGPNILIEVAEILTAQKDWQKALSFWLDAQNAHQRLTKPNATTAQHIRFNISIIKRLTNIESYKKEINKYAADKKRRKIAVITSVTKGYDTIKPPETLDRKFDYYIFTNDKPESLGIYKVRPLPEPELDDGRAIRYVKTHPHTLLKDYEIVVWVDTSLMIIGDIYPIIKKFAESNKAIGSGVHPLRKNIYEELEANKRLHKENYKLMKKQVETYRREGFKHDDLSENTLLMFNINHDKLSGAMETWWEQICKFSKRDQLSFNYSLVKNGVEWFPLTRPPKDIRNHPSFVWTPHKTEQSVLAELEERLKDLKT